MYYNVRVGSNIERGKSLEGGMMCQKRQMAVVASGGEDIVVVSTKFYFLGRTTRLEKKA